MGFIFFGGGDTVKIKECTKMFMGFFFVFFVFIDWFVLVGSLSAGTDGGPGNSMID